MSRTVTDLAKLLDVIVGYDPEDPITARGVGQIPDSYTRFLDKNGLQRARIGILRESMGYDAEPGSEDFSKVTAVFDKAIAELKAAGAAIVDPIVIPKLKVLLAKRAGSFTDEEEAFANYLSRSAKPPYNLARKQRVRRIFRRSLSVHGSGGQEPRQRMRTMSTSWHVKN
jgi:Asp-tRNA(Asn)/Glu-tRNA(Gln) amidotransferase A subunit family amidase